MAAPKIVVVEDEPIVALDLKHHLVNLGYNVVATPSTAAKAIASAREFDPDLILMDVKLKGSPDGIEAARCITAERDTPIIFLTAFADGQTQERIKATSSYGYIVKPCDKRMLGTLIELALSRHRVSRELAENRTWLLATLDNVGDGVIATDAAGTIKFINPVAKAFTGWQQGSTVHQPLSDSAESAVREVAATVRAQDGSARDVEFRVATLAPTNAVTTCGQVWVMHDITEHKRQQDADDILAEVASLLSQPLNGEINFADILAVLVPRMVDAASIDLLDKDGIWHNAASITMGTFEGTCHTAQLPLMVRRGGTVLGSLTITRSRERCESQPYAVKTLEQVAERLATAIDNAALYGASQRAVRLREDMLRIVSHDLKNPLSAILLSSQHLERINGSVADINKKHLGTIRRCADRMLTMVTDLLAVGKIEDGSFVIERSPCEPHMLLQDAMDTFHLALQGRQVQVSVDPAITPDVYVLCDRERMLQVFSNLIGNAIKFTPENGVITLSARRQGQVVVFAVSDTGVGVPPEHLPHLFERYWQGAVERKKGTGLGLYIAKVIVEGNGGKIWAESKINVGTTFYFTLPTGTGLQDATQPPPHTTQIQTSSAANLT